MQMGGVSSVHASHDGKQYFVGSNTGEVEIYSNAKLESLSYMKSIGSKVVSIASSDKYVAYSSKGGIVIIYDLNEKEFFTIHEGEHPVISLKIAVEKNYLYGILDKTPDEKCLVWNMATKKLVHQHELDIEDNKALKEDASKLMVHHTEDTSVLFIRGCYRKGVKILSFDDGVLIDEIPKMHTKSILQILIKYDR
jgi:WD40 repeat protein